MSMCSVADFMEGPFGRESASDNTNVSGRRGTSLLSG